MRALLVLLPLLLPASARALTLGECLAGARERSVEVAAARARVEAAEARAAGQRGQLLPQVDGIGSLSASAGALAPGAFIGIGDRPAPGLFDSPGAETWRAALQVRQVLFDLTVLAAAVSAGTLADAIEAGERATMELVLLETESVYRNALAARELVDAARAAVTRAEKAHELAAARAQVGLRPRFDVLRAEVELEDARLRLITAENDRDLATTRLALACGMPSVPREVEISPAARSLVAPPGLEPAWEEAREHRAELRFARKNVEALEEARLASVGVWLPRLEAQGSLEYLERVLPETAVDGPGWSGLVTLTMPILAGGSDLALVREAAARLAEARALYARAELTVRADLEGALLGVRTAGAQVTAAHKLEESARAALALAEARYAAGQGDVIEVADAQQQLADAEARRVRADLDEALASTRLERALGRWEIR